MSPSRVTHHAFIGTSGWNYDHWKGRFYPEDLPSSRWLEYYAKHFSTVEINFSFYRWPEREQFEKWAGQTPDDFIFAVKASQYLTHRKKLKDAAEPVERTITHARGLGDKLGPVLFQLPPHWKVNLQRLRDFLALLPRDARYAMEFRDPSWLVDEVFAVLEESGVANCIMAAPGLPRVMKVTAPFSYIRMHSGGEETEGKFDDMQLEWWAEQVQEMLKTVDVYVYFNNDYKGFALENALRLRELVCGL
jgi:uncharacterized protein YecE (DUF72 family)